MASFKTLLSKAEAWWDYCSEGVWRDTRRTWKVNFIKTLNLSVRSFFNADLQTQACAMTYRTLLAIVPALALIFAIGRGFGLQSVISDELRKLFPAQQQAVDYALNFVDSYLSTSSEGIFLGVGILFLLWTLISLLSSVEDTFNLIWGVKEGRPLARKITDYTAILLILPIFMICASGLSLLLSSTLDAIFHFDFLSPLVSVLIELSSWALMWIFFTLVYVLMPNTKVKLKNAIIPGILAGTGYMILQWIFVTGQMYVARYNAIYGSFSFLPLMLIWLQLVFLVMFAGAVICYSAQNIFMYSFRDAINNISSTYYAQLSLAIGAVIVQRFVKSEGPTTVNYLTDVYNMPPRLVGIICERMVTAGLLSLVEIDPKQESIGYQPALDPSLLTVAEVYKRLDACGSSDFIQDFDKNFSGVVADFNLIHNNELKVTETILLRDIKVELHPVNTPSQNAIEKTN